MDSGGRVSNDPYFGADPTPNRKQEQATVRFRFVAVPSAKTSYPVEVRETYSDGKVIHWTGTRSYAFPASPQGTDLRPPIMLRSTGTRSRPYGWIAGIGAAVVLVCAAAFVAVRARASRRPA